MKTPKKESKRRTSWRSSLSNAPQGWGTRSAMEIPEKDHNFASMTMSVDEQPRSNRRAVDGSEISAFDQKSGHTPVSAEEGKHPEPNKEAKKRRRGGQSQG